MPVEACLEVVVELAYWFVVVLLVYVLDIVELLYVLEVVELTALEVNFVSVDIQT